MAYFHCLIGGGSSGGGYELTVTCDAQFAGTTITCTDGVTTLTQTCPSASPYEVVFEIPNGGDWTISGVVAGHTVSTGVNIPTSAELIAVVQQTVTIHSAKEDTISYTDIDGATQTITFASGETSKQVQITIEPNGSSITFTSSVAKNPDNLSQDYSKTFTITPSTTEIYLMPDAVKTLYWWGYESDNLEDMTAANGWTQSNYSYDAPTHNKNNITCVSSSNKLMGVASKNKIQGSNFKSIIRKTGSGDNNLIFYNSLKNTNNTEMVFTVFNNTSDAVIQSPISINEAYIGIRSAVGSSSIMSALWYE